MFCEDISVESIPSSELLGNRILIGSVFEDTAGFPKWVYQSILP